MADAESAVDGTAPHDNDDNHNTAQGETKKPERTGGGGDPTRTIVCTGHSRPIPQIEFKDTERDGLFLISACLDNRPMLRNGATGDWIGSFVGHNGAVWCARLNSNATRAVTASADYTAKYWDAVSGKMRHSFEHQHIVRAASFSNCNNYVYTAGHEGKIRIYDLNKPDADPLVCGLSGSRIQHILTPKRENSILSSDDKGKKLCVWDTRTLRVVKTLETGEIITDLNSSLDKSLICATAGKSVFFWNMETYELKKSFSMERELMSVAVDPKRGRLVLGSHELWVRRYDFETGKEVACTKGHHGPVGTLAFTPSGKFASGSVDGTIRICHWDVKDDIAQKEK